MPNWVITSTAGNPGWSSRLGNCSREHAETVLAQLEGDTSVPNHLVLRELDVPRPSLLRRLVNRG